MNDMKSLQQLQADIEEVDARIAAHPLSSAPVKAAHAIIESHGGNDKEAVSRELTEHDLPGLEELGRIQLVGSASWWRLHRDRNRLTKKIERLKN